MQINSTIDVLEQMEFHQFLNNQQFAISFSPIFYLKKKKLNMFKNPAYLADFKYSVEFDLTRAVFIYVPKIERI